MTNRSQILIPCRDVVTEPVSDIAASTDKGTARDDHGSLVGSSLEHAVATSFAHHSSVQIVCIIFSPVPTMDEISLGSLVAEAARCILDLVRWKEKVPIRETLLITIALSASDATNLRRGIFVLITGEVAEAGGLVHVDPKCVDVDSSIFVKESSKFIVPVALCVLSKPIRKDGCTRPYLTFPRYAGARLHESVGLDAPIVRTIVLSSDS